jgi:hypothetical protein
MTSDDGGSVCYKNNLPIKLLRSFEVQWNLFFYKKDTHIPIAKLSLVLKIFSLYFNSFPRQRDLSGPSARRTKDMLKLNKDQLRWVVGLPTGHCHLKGHLFKMGLTDDPSCEWCLEEVESATHISCDCEAVANLRFRHLGQFFMDPSDYYGSPINKVLHIHSKCRINKGQTIGEAQ